VTWRLTRTGEYQREDAQVVVLAGGCTENPRLWFNSGLPNPNDWVGRGYTDHHFDWVIGVMDRYTGSSKGPGSSARCDFPGHGGLENVGLPPALRVITHGQEGEGQRLLPVQNTHSPVDADLLNDINRLPERQRLTLILNELGAGLAGRGSDLGRAGRLYALSAFAPESAARRYAEIYHQVIGAHAS